MSTVNFELAAKIKELRSVIGPRQILAMTAATNGVDADGRSAAKVEEIYTLYGDCPRTYETDGMKGAAIAQFRYFLGDDSEFYITELDVSGPPHIQAYGFGSLNGQYPEMGYINIPELLQNGFEMDYHFKPKTLTDLGLWKHD